MEVPQPTGASIPEGKELRIVLKYGQTVSIAVMNGMAQLWGWTLPISEEIFMSNRSFAIYAVQNTDVRITGTFSSCYVARSSPVKVINTLASLKPGPKPVFLVTGAPSSGKTSFARWLSNLLLFDANNTGSKPIYVNCDPSEPLFAPTGCVGALPLSRPITQDGFPFMDPLVYFFGHEDVCQERMPLFISLINELATHVMRRVKDYREGPVVIDAPRGEWLGSIIEVFGVTHIVVIGDDGLFRRLHGAYPLAQATKVPAVQGVTITPKNDLRRIRDTMIKRYFDGDPKQVLYARNFEYEQNSFNVRSIGPFSIEQNRDGNPKKAEDVPFSAANLINRIIAIVSATSDTELWKQNALGFARVIRFNEENGSIIIAKANSHELPQTMLIVGSVKTLME